jgi:hypothetical protein
MEIIQHNITNNILLNNMIKLNCSDTISSYLDSLNGIICKFYGLLLYRLEYHNIEQHQQILKKIQGKQYNININHIDIIKKYTNDIMNRGNNDILIILKWLEYYIDNIITNNISDLQYIKIESEYALTILDNIFTFIYYKYYFNKIIV